MTAAVNEAPVLQIRNLAVRYGSRSALSGVTLDIAPRQITTIIGPSGCGKSTFLGCLNRLNDLIPGCRVSGEVLFGGENVLSRETDVIDLRRRIGMIFQQPQPFPMSIRRNLELPLQEHGVRDRAERVVRLEQSLRDVSLWEEVKSRLETSALELSGGQQQRLCLARALVLRPDVLLLDEPCSALDPVSAEAIEALLLELKSRMTLVVVTHNLAQARRISDRIAVFWADESGGRLIETGAASEVLTAPRDPLTSAYVTGRVG